MKRFISISLFFLSFKQKPNFTCYRSFSSPSLVFFLLPPSLFCFVFPFRASPTRRIELEIAAAPGERGGGGHNGRARKERGRGRTIEKQRADRTLFQNLSLSPLPSLIPASALRGRPRALRQSDPKKERKKERKKKKKNSATCEFRSRYLPISLSSILGSLGVLIMRRTLCRLS